MLAVDTARTVRHPTTPPPTPPSSSTSFRSSTSTGPLSASSPLDPSSIRPLSKFLNQAEQILADFRVLEHRLAAEDKRRTIKPDALQIGWKTTTLGSQPTSPKSSCSPTSLHPSKALKRRRRQSHQPRRRHAAYAQKGNCYTGLNMVATFRAQKPACSESDPDSCADSRSNGGGTSAAFHSFCERLLMMNQIWRQERQLKALAVANEEKKRQRAHTAFQTFCDQLLLWNRVWRLEREIKTLVADGEKMRRSRVAAVTRAAKQMVLDVRKERLVEEFAKDLIRETAEHRQEVARVKEQHEHEIREVNGDWAKDYRKLVRELEGLKLSREARMIEQELNNDVEQDLHDAARAYKAKIRELEERLALYEQTDDALSSDGTVVESSGAARRPRSSDLESDAISEVSSTSTCVSSTPYSGSLEAGSGIVQLAQRKRRVTFGSTTTMMSSFSRPTESSRNRAASVVEPKSYTGGGGGHAAATSTTDHTTMNRSSNESDISTRTCVHHHHRPGTSLSGVAPRSRTTSMPSSVTSLAKSSEFGALKARAPWRV